MTVSTRFDQGDGTDVRHVRIDDVEIAARVYFALRTPRWGTVPFAVRSRVVDESEAGFSLELELTSTDAAMPLDATVRYVADSTGLRASFEAFARGAFQAARLGLCLLHPIDGYLGRPIRVSGGAHDLESEIPVEVAPQLRLDGVLTPMFGTDFDRLRIGLDEWDLDITFAGDTFEIEDQRNWTDASFKSYSGPLARGFLDVQEGQRFAQSIELRLSPGWTRCFQLTPDGGSGGGVLPPIRLWDGVIDGAPYRPQNCFAGLNRDRPSAADLADHDGVLLGVLASGHAADDASVMETAAMHGTVVRQARALTSLPVHLGPMDHNAIPGQWMDAAGTHQPEPPTPPSDPRRTGAFGAAWIVASLASLAGADAASLAYYDTSVADAPAGRLIAELALLAGQPVLRVTSPVGTVAITVGTTRYEADLDPPYALRRTAS